MRLRVRLLPALVLSALVLPCGGAPAAFGAAPDLARPGARPVARAAGAGGISYFGGAVLHWSRVHLIFWQPSGSGLSFDPGYIPLVERFVADVAADSHSTSNVFGITGQYTDPGGPAAYSIRDAPAVLDSDPLPRNGCLEPLLTGPPGWTDCLTDAQLQSELERVARAARIPVSGHDVLVLVTPRGLGDCSDGTSSSCALGGSATGYCGYHAASGGGLLYAVIPYNAVPGHCQSSNPRPNASTADPALSTLAHELAEVMTDPYGDGWTDSAGNEIGDVCITSFGRAVGGSGAGRWNEVIDGHHYWLQELLSRVTGACAPRPQPDRVRLRVGRLPRPGRSAMLAAFSAAAAVPGGRAVAYRWWFGDGRAGRGRSVHHRYARAGRYRLLVRITDSAGNWAFARRTIRIR